MARRHFVLMGKGLRSACGLDNPPDVTVNPGRVTCDRCRATAALSDALIRAVHRPPPKRRRTKKKNSLGRRHT